MYRNHLVLAGLFLFFPVLSSAQRPELVVQTGHSEAVDSVAFSPDGKMLVSSGGADLTIKLWEVSSGTELRTLRGHFSAVTSVVFSRDGKTLASGSIDGTVKLWDVASGNELGSFGDHSASVNSVALDLDRHRLASADDDGTIKIWDVNSGRELHTLRGHADVVTCIKFSPDGKTLISGSRDKTIKLWDLTTANELRTFKGHFGWVQSVALSADGKILASGGNDNLIKLWDVAAGSELRTLTGHSEWVTSVDFSADGKNLASSSNDKTIKLWDVASGNELRTLRGHAEEVRSVAFSVDGKMLASSSNDRTIKFWEVATGNELRTLAAHSNVPIALAFSPDGKTLLSRNRDRTIRSWDLANGGGELSAFVADSVWSPEVAISADEKIAASTEDTTIKLWDTASRTELRTLKGHSDWVSCVEFSPDGKTLASGSRDHTVKLWDVASGNELRTLKGHSDLITSVAFSPEGKMLASGSWDRNVKLWDVVRGSELGTFKGHSNGVASVAFSPDGKMLASGGWDTLIKLWSLSDRKELASLVALDQRDWLVVTPEGLFDGSPNGWKQVLWRFNNNTFDHAPVEAFFNEYYYPGLLADILAGKRPRPPKTDLTAIDIRQPQLKITSIDDETPVEVAAGQPFKLEHPVGLVFKQAEITIEIVDNVDPTHGADQPSSSGAKDLRLFRNGTLIRLWEGDIFAGHTAGCELETVKAGEPRRAICKTTRAIVAGENEFTAYAFNHDNVKTSDFEVIATGLDRWKRKGTLHILAIGVNSYRNSEYNLKYAVADATDFAQEIKRQQESLNRYDKVQVTLLTDAQATNFNITQKLFDFWTEVEPEDAVIVYFAGHGTAQGNQFYLIPHDLGYEGPREELSAAGLQAILKHSISDRELEKWFLGIDAGQLLLVIDACNSGQALEAEEKRRGPMNSKGLAQLAYEKGMYVLTAAQSYQAAQEAARFGHGFLTYALVEEGLKQGAADREPKNGSIDIREWLNFATDEVPKMQEKNSVDALRGRGRYLVFVGDGREVGIPKTEAETRDNVQRPRVFYRRELDINPFVVGTAGAVPNH